jgi:hypothetical protein
VRIAGRLLEQIEKNLVSRDDVEHGWIGGGPGRGRPGESAGNAARGAAF